MGFNFVGLTIDGFFIVGRIDGDDCDEEMKFPTFNFSIFNFQFLRLVAKRLLSWSVCPRPMYGIVSMISLFNVRWRKRYRTERYGTVLDVAVE